jgi:hypothetical protein
MKPILAMVTVLIAVAICDAGAQTRSSSKKQSKWSIPPTAKAPDKALKPCLRYGEGFYHLPGTDTCVKINGYVQTDVSVGSSR